MYVGCLGSFPVCARRAAVEVTCSDALRCRVALRPNNGGLAALLEFVSLLHDITSLHLGLDVAVRCGRCASASSLRVCTVSPKKQRDEALVVPTNQYALHVGVLVYV